MKTLMDYIHPHKRVAETSTLSYRKVKADGVEASQKETVFYALLKYPEGMYDLQIAEDTGFTINVVNARRNRLVKDGAVHDNGVVKSWHTGRPVTRWKVKTE